MLYRHTNLYGRSEIVVVAAICLQQLAFEGLNQIFLWKQLKKLLKL